MELRLKIHISKAGCSWGNLWFIPLQRTEKILQEGVSCREGEPESGGSKSADRIWIILVGQDPLVWAPRESEERNQAGICPRPLVITHLPQPGGRGEMLHQSCKWRAPLPGSHVTPLVLSHGLSVCCGCLCASACAQVLCPYVACHRLRLPWLLSCPKASPSLQHVSCLEMFARHLRQMYIFCAVF